MCHCFRSVEDLSEEERATVLAEHSETELREELSEDEYETLRAAA